MQIEANNTKISKGWFYAIGVLVLLILLVIGFEFYLSNKSLFKIGGSSKTNTSSESAVVDPNDHSKELKTLLVWMETQKDPRDAYYYGNKCTKDGVCEKPMISNFSGLQVLWGLNKNYEKTKDASTLSLIKKNIDVYSDQKKIIEIGASSLTCGYLLDLWKDKSLSTDYLDKIKQICGKVLPVDAFNYKLDGVTTEGLKSDINSKLDKFVASGMKVGSGNGSGVITDILGLEPYYGFSREYLAQSMITGDVLAEKKAYYLLDKLLDDYIGGSKAMTTSSQFCEFGSMVLDFNLDKGNNVTLAKGIFDLISDNVATVECAMLADKLGNKEYKDIFLKNQIKSNWENNHFVTYDKQGNKITDIGYNGLMVGLLSQ